MSGLSIVDIAWVCLSGPWTADIGPVDGRRRARWQQTLLEFVCRARRRQTSGTSTADVGYVDGRCRATFWNLSVWPVDGRRRARWRQMSGPLTADVELPLGILSVWPVDGRCRARWRQTSSYLWEFCLSGLLTADVGPVDGRRRARRRQTTICHRRAPDERRCRFCRAPW
jgi:hypothetical protein